MSFNAHLVILVLSIAALALALVSWRIGKPKRWEDFSGADCWGLFMLILAGALGTIMILDGLAGG